MTEIIKALVHRSDYPNPEVGDRYADEELGTLTLIEVTPVGDRFVLVYESDRPRDDREGTSNRS